MFSRCSSSSLFAPRGSFLAFLLPLSRITAPTTASFTHPTPSTQTVVWWQQQKQNRASCLHLSPLRAQTTSKSTHPMMMKLPKPPVRQYSRPQIDELNSDKSSSMTSIALQADVDLTNLRAQINASEERRQEAYNLSRQMQSALNRARRAVIKEQPISTNAGAAAGSDSVAATPKPPSSSDDSNTLDAFWKDPLLLIAAQHSVSPHVSDENHHRLPREANLSYRVEEYVRLRAFEHFLQTGQLIPPQQVISSSVTAASPVATGENCDGVTAMEISSTSSQSTEKPAAVSSSSSSSSLSLLTDEEYLAGACMGLAQDLQRYGLGRATVRDVSSVEAARDVVEQILDYLLQLDFRNGNLRRKYDGTKYALKGLETLLYELSITGAAETKTEGEEKQHQKRAKPELLPNKELHAIKERMEHRDKLRERLIKDCRDGQKAAKQAIFALHRGDTERALKLQEQCLKCIEEKLEPIVREEPPLRMGGPFPNVLEEYVEARLFTAWLHGNEQKDSSTEQQQTKSPRGLLLRPEDFSIALEPEEYLGGLCDLTGEVGRFAVQQGTARNVDNVKLCLRTNDNILAALEDLDRLPGQIGKKVGMVRQGVEKLERMLYEMSLSEATGRNVQTSVTEVDSNLAGGD